MDGIFIWAIILFPSAIWGLFCGLKISSRYSLLLSGAIPWLGLLIALLMTEYVFQPSGTDASMWLIAQFFAGTIIAGVGMCSQKAGRFLLKKIT